MGWFNRKYVLRVRNCFIFLIILVLIYVYKEREEYKDIVVSQVPENVLKYIFFEKNEDDIKNIFNVRALVSRYNLDEHISNLDIYGPINRDTPIIVITAGKLSVSIEFLLVSLSQVRGIEETLIIFSHAYFDLNMNNLVRSIDFCRVLQIFYPYSIQMYPYEFPGWDPRDCPYNMKMSTANQKNCTGAGNHDFHERYRHPIHSEKKLHWWWSANTIFETLNATKDHTGLVIFLRDDIYVLNDFLFMIQAMKNISKPVNKCDLLSLDYFPLMYDIDKIYDAGVMIWNPKSDPKVLAFDIRTWNSIVSRYDLFCNIDDYSWARSLYYVSVESKDGNRFRVMSSVVPRAFTTSSCGLDDDLVDCDIFKSIYQVLQLKRTVANIWYPNTIKTFVEAELDDRFVDFDYASINGGWSDPRDKELCVNITKGRIKKVILDMRKDFRRFGVD